MSHDYNEGFAAGCLEQEGYEAELRRLRAEVERLRAELDRRTTLNPAKEMLGWTPKEPSPLPLWGKGCPVCGIGSQPGVYGVVCARGDCPTRVTCGEPK